jgi:WhiB family redox-sensing transcriptional regulator
MRTRDDGGTGRGPGAAATTDTTATTVTAEATGSVVPCRTLDPDMWFAEHSAVLDRAKAVCRDCPIRLECLTGAQRRQEPWGVWGGEIFIAGAVVAHKRGRGRPSNADRLRERAHAAPDGATSPAASRPAATSGGAGPGAGHR